jgi:hypothetical protein
MERRLLIEKHIPIWTLELGFTTLFIDLNRKPSSECQRIGLMMHRPIILRMIPHLRPNVLFIFGGVSDVGTPKMQKDLMERTGVGIGGSGGVKEGAVSKHVFENLGHLMPMEDPAGCSKVASAWLGKELKIWGEKEAKFRQEWSEVPAREKMMVSEEWKERIGGPLRPPGAKL